MEASVRVQLFVRRLYSIPDDIPNLGNYVPFDTCLLIHRHLIFNVLLKVHVGHFVPGLVFVVVLAKFLDSVVCQVDKTVIVFECELFTARA
jgi:hypothetical protein